MPEGFLKAPRPQDL